MMTASSRSAVLLVACSMTTLTACAGSVEPTSDAVAPPAPANAVVRDFEESGAAAVPAGFRAGLTGGGAAVDWQLLEVSDAPSGSKVVAQLSADTTNRRYPLLILDGFEARDVDLEVKFKTVSGEVDASGGLVFRYRDDDNYYVVRANALEDNVVAYKTENGKRSDIGVKGRESAYGVEVDVPHGEWNSLRLIARGALFEVFLNGRKLFEVENDTFRTAGKIGLWTKADAVTQFDDLRVTRLPQSEPRVVVIYSSVDEFFARPIVEEFERETGIEARLVPDTEETKSTGLLNRLIAERNRPQADVFWSGDPVRAAVLKARGLSAPYRSPAAEGLPREFSDPDAHWTGFSARARVIIYNTDAISRDEAPGSVLELTDPRFRGRACVANPLFGTTAMHAAALFSLLGEDDAKRFFDDFAANGGRILSSNGEVRRRVAAGECEVGITDTDDFNVARLEGRPVAAVYPDANGMGTVVIPNAVVLIAGAPHPAAGERFIDFLLRPETELLLAESAAAQMPLRRSVAVPAHVRQLDSLRPMELDYDSLAPLLEKLSRGFLKEWVDRNSR